LTNRKNQNSIIVLATLGVYLGLVLAGATPQVLAQAAMTRQFDVKDEIEVKDDLDNKPDRAAVQESTDNPSATKALVSESVNRFLLSFEPVVSTSDSFITSTNAHRLLAVAYRQLPLVSYPSLHLQDRFTRLVSVSNFARASLDPLLS
jgi:hypothetical protein